MSSEDVTPIGHTPGVPSLDQVYGMGVGTMVWVVVNLGQKMPYLSRVPLGAALISGGYLCGNVLTNIKRDRQIRRDLVIMDYIQRHPEDFPELKPKKYRDLLLDWNPQR